MIRKRMRLIFQDEAPRIGCGERGVNIRLGRKYVYVTERASGIKVKMPIRSFEQLAAATQRRLDARKGRNAKRTPSAKSLAVSPFGQS